MMEAQQHESMKGVSPTRMIFPSRLTASIELILHDEHTSCLLTQSYLILDALRRPYPETPFCLVCFRAQKAHMWAH